MRLSRASNPFSSFTSFQNSLMVRLFFISLPDEEEYSGEHDCRESRVSHELRTEVDKHLLSITVDFVGH